MIEDVNFRNRSTRLARSALAAALIGVGLAGCGNQAPAEIDYRGTDPYATASSPAPATDNRGIVKIDNYDAVVAREGDTMESVAARVGISASELAAYNGYPAGFSPRAGDILVLPPRPGGYGAVSATQGASAAPSAAPATSPSSTERWSPAIAAAAIERGDQPSTTDNATASAVDADASASLFAPLAAPLDQPAGASATRYQPTGREITYVAMSGDTMFSVANKHSVTVGELAYANGLQASDVINPGQVLIIPDFGEFNRPPEATTVATAAAPAASSTATTSGDVIIVDDTGAGRVEQPAAATVASAPAPVDTGAQFLSPVSGPIIEGYTAKRGGVEFGAAPGTPVRAADDGTVVLVSKSLGGLGTIILVRHDSQHMTVYGRVEDNRVVEKGQRVTRGQTIATVAEPTSGREPSLHFEIRRGTVSIDPEPLI